MTRLLTAPVDDTIMDQIEHLVRMMGKPEKTVIREVVETGLKSYKTIPSRGAQAVLDLIAWAEKEHITGHAKDVSTRHNRSAWEK